MTRPTYKEIISVLDGNAENDLVRNRIMLWLSGEEGRRWIEQNSERLFGHCEKEPDIMEIPTEAMLAHIHKGTAASDRRLRLRSFLKYVAAALLPLLIAGGVFAWANSRMDLIAFSEGKTVTETSASGGNKTIVFSDGTRVSLKPGSVASYPTRWGFRERGFSLEGEAFFDVAKNPRRPFVVDILGHTLKVYGTTFNVRANPGEETIGITLIDGSVAFETEGVTYSLSPSEKLTYSKTTGNVAIEKLIHPENSALWMDGILSFRNSGLKEVMDEISRWYGIGYTVEDESLLGCTFTFTTETGRLEEILSEMEYISDISFEISEKTIIISKK